MSDPVEVLLNSPRSQKAIQRLGFSKEDLRYLSKEDMKVKIGNMKISKNELNNKWDDYEQERKDKIAQILEVSYKNNFHVFMIKIHLGKEASGK